MYKQRNNKKDRNHEEEPNRNSITENKTFEITKAQDQKRIQKMNTASRKMNTPFTGLHQAEQHIHYGSTNGE